MPRWAAKIDSNQKEIVDKLRQCGVHVLHLHMVGKNAPDICCAYRQRNFLLEIKSTKKTLKREADQVAWHEKWDGPSAIVRSFDEAWAFIQHSTETKST